MRKTPTPLLTKTAIQTLGDVCFGALVLLVILLPFYVRFSETNLSYTPELRFQFSGTNATIIEPSSGVEGRK